jgi:Flp pilus assembly protein TadG
MINTRKRIRNEQGQTMTEFALVLPIFITLLFAIIQFGIVFNNYVTLTDAARAGARKAAVSRNDPDPSATCQNYVKSSAGDLTPGSIGVSCVPSGGSWSPGNDVTVDATYPYTINIFGMSLVTGNLHTVTKERIE